MLDTKQKLKECLRREKKFYRSSKSLHDQCVEWVVKDDRLSFIQTSEESIRTETGD